MIFIILFDEDRRIVYLITYHTMYNIALHFTRPKHAVGCSHAQDQLWILASASGQGH